MPSRIALSLGTESATAAALDLLLIPPPEVARSVAGQRHYCDPAHQLACNIPK
jgi:hypothetical protein